MLGVLKGDKFNLLKNYSTNGLAVTSVNLPCALSSSYSSTSSDKKQSSIISIFSKKVSAKSYTVNPVFGLKPLYSGVDSVRRTPSEHPRQMAVVSFCDKFEMDFLGTNIILEDLCSIFFFLKKHNNICNPFLASPFAIELTVFVERRNDSV